jgi:hypothetical protein
VSIGRAVDRKAVFVWGSCFKIGMRSSVIYMMILCLGNMEYRDCKRDPISLLMQMKWELCLEEG